MAKENQGGINILAEAYKQSNGQTVDVVIDHEIMKGITFDLMLFWGNFINDPVYYKMWHPQDHIAQEIKEEEIPGKGKVIVIYAHEKVGEYPASKLRARGENPMAIDIKRKYKPFSCGIMLGPNNEEMGFIYHECEDSPQGLKMRTTYRMPAKTPKKFQEAMAKHSREENSNLVKILPALYEKEKDKVGKKQPKP
jgi:hypothetical protein